VAIPRNLRRPVPNEKKLMDTFLDREGRRVSDIAARAPARAKALKEAEKAKVSVDTAAGCSTNNQEQAWPLPGGHSIHTL
jgi:hypothetical protein